MRPSLPATVVRLRILTALFLGVATRSAATTVIGPADLAPTLTAYLVADGRPRRVAVTVRQTGTREPERLMVRHLLPDESVVYRRYIEYVPVGDLLPGLSDGIELRAIEAAPDSGDVIFEQTFDLSAPGIHQIRLVGGARSSAATLVLDAQTGYGLGFQNGAYGPWDRTLTQAYAFVPPHAEKLVLQGGPVRLVDDEGVDLGVLNGDESKEFAVTKQEVVWRVEFPEPDNWQLRAAGMPFILCNSAAAARAIRASVVELPDGTTVCHQVQARIAAMLPELLDAERVGRAEDLVVPLAARRDAWLRDPLRNLVLMRSFLPDVEHWLRAQNVNPASHWSGAMDLWPELEGKAGVEGRWDRLVAVAGARAGVSSGDASDAAYSLALAATHDAPTNPYYGRTELLYRAAAASLRDLMVLQEDEVFPGVVDLSDYPGMMAFVLGQKTLPAFGVAGPHLPREVRELWADALRPIVDRSVPDELTSARNQSSHYLVAYQAYALGSGDPFYRDLARIFARRWVRGQSAAGYHMEAIGPCASYIGMTHWHEALYYRMSQDEAVLESVRRSYEFYNHTIAPEPDGRLLGGFNFNHRVGEGFYLEQYGGAKGILDDVLPEVGLHQQGAVPGDEETASERVNAFLDEPSRPPYAAITTPRYLWHAEADRSATWPALAETSFIRQFADELVAVKRPAYYAVVYTGKPVVHDFYIRGREHLRQPFAGDIERHGGELPEFREVTPFVGGGLSGFWTPDFGHSLLAANWTPTTHHGLTATVVDGSRYWEDYFAHEHELNTETGVLRFNGRIEGQALEYERVYHFEDEQLGIELALTATGDVDLAGLVETIPVARGGWKANGSVITAGGRTTGRARSERFTVTDEDGVGIEVVFDAVQEMELVPDGLRAGNWRQLQIGRVEVVLPRQLAKGERMTLNYSVRPLAKAAKEEAEKEGQVDAAPARKEPAKGEAAAARPSTTEQIKAVARTDENLPTVLLMGDSIANGYAAGVATRLEGVANVDLFVTGKHVVSNLWQDVTPVVAHRPYRVIHFNESTLHAWPPGRVQEGEYEPAFRQYVEAIRANAPEARLIWAAATPMSLEGKPTELDPEFDPKIAGWNQVALRVVRESGMAVNDLYTLMLDHLELGAGDRFHWSAEGKDVQAAAVAEAIRGVLEE